MHYFENDEVRNPFMFVPAFPPSHTNFGGLQGTQLSDMYDE